MASGLNEDVAKNNNADQLRSRTFALVKDSTHDTTQMMLHIVFLQNKCSFFFIKLSFNCV